MKPTVTLSKILEFSVVCCLKQRNKIHNEDKVIFRHFSVEMLHIILVILQNYYNML